MTNKELEKVVNEFDVALRDMHDVVNELRESIKKLEAKVFYEPKKVQKVEAYNGPEPEIRESKGLNMNSEEKITSMRNAIKILPPNLKDSQGRHALKNVEAIVGFKVNDDMMEEAYRGL